MDIVLRGVAIFFLIFLLTRVIGRRELASLEPFDLILLIVLGDAVQQGLTQDDYSVTGAMLAVGTIAILQVLMSWVHWRFPRVRPLMDGEPIVVVQDGELLEKNMKRQRLTAEDVFESMRLEQIASLAEVQWAVLETSGKLSFVKKAG